MTALAFDRAALRELVSRPGPCVSLFLPAPRPLEAEADAALLRRVVAAAADRLAAAGMRDEIGRTLAPASELLAEHGLWRRATAGLAVYLAPGFGRAFHLPAAAGSRLEVGGGFVVRPLLPLLAEAGSFYVLALSRSHVRLLAGTRDGVRRVPLAGVPASMQEALGYDAFVTDVQLYTFAGQRPGERWGVFHGHGDPDEEHFKSDLWNYFHRLAEALRPHLADPRAPLVLAAVEEYLPLYRDASADPRLVPAVVAGSPDHRSDLELRDAAWPLVAPYLAAGRDAAVRRFTARAGVGRTAVGVEPTLTAAAAGRVEALFVAAEAEAWGRRDPETGRLEIRGERRAGDDDLLELAVAETVRHGGEAWSLPFAQMPAPARSAATLRF